MSVPPILSNSALPELIVGDTYFDHQARPWQFSNSNFFYFWKYQFVLVVPMAVHSIIPLLGLIIGDIASKQQTHPFNISD